MGCDIHMYVEVKKTVNGELTWVNVDNWRVNQYYDPTDPDGEKPYSVEPIYRQRHYSLFALLANVRNYGEDTPISEPRGLPADISPQTEAEAEYWDSEGHSHSHFTLAELKAHRAETKTVHYRGLVSSKGAAQIDRGEMPDMYCRGASPSLGYVWREWTHESDLLYDIIKELDARMRDEFWIWDKEEHPDKDKCTRIVFWFDN
jgi:hypothetical protein